MESLPDELVLVILRQLEARSLVRMGAVSKRYQALSAEIPVRAVLTPRRYAKLKPWLLEPSQRPIAGLTVARVRNMATHHFTWLEDLRNMVTFRTAMSRCTPSLLSVLPQTLTRLEIDRLRPSSWGLDSFALLTVLLLLPNVRHVSIVFNDRFWRVFIDGRPGRLDFLHLCVSNPRAIMLVEGYPARVCKLSGSVVLLDTRVPDDATFDVC